MGGREILAHLRWFYTLYILSQGTHGTRYATDVYGFTTKHWLGPLGARHDTPSERRDLYRDPARSGDLRCPAPPPALPPVLWNAA